MKKIQEKAFVFASFFSAVAPLSLANAGGLSESFESGFGRFSLGGDYNFIRRTGSTSSGGTGPNKAHAGSYYIYLEASSGHANRSGDTAYLTAANVSGEELSFYYHMYGGHIGELRVRILSNGRWYTAWSADGRQHTSAGSSWAPATIDLTEYSDNVTIRFEAIANGGYQGDIAIDDINITSYAEESVYYHYDTLGRVVRVEDTKNNDRNYVYDPAGNRTSVSVGSSGGGNSDIASPTAKNDYITLNGLYAPKTINVLSNDVDPSGNGLTIENINYNNSVLTVTNRGNGNLEVVAKGVAASTSFTYTVTNAPGNTDTATVFVNNNFEVFR